MASSERDCEYDLIHLRVPASTQMRDLSRALCEAKSIVHQVNSENNHDRNESVSHCLFVVIKQDDGQERNAINEDEIDLNEEEHLARANLHLRGCFLYCYMWMTFQWIEPIESGAYSGNIPFVVYKIMRFVVALSLWTVVGFELLLFFTAKRDPLTTTVAVMHCLLWTQGYVILYHLGLYFFQVHRGRINDVLNNSRRVSQNQWKHVHQFIQDLMATTAFFLLALPLIIKLIPIFLERASGVRGDWDATVETVEFFVLVYNRVVSMPIFFFFALVVQIHILELKKFEEQLTQSKETLTDLFKQYKALTKRIQESSQAFQPYLIGLLLLLVLWGFVGVYSCLEMFEHIPPPEKSSYNVILSKSLGTFIGFVCETAFLFSLPLYKSGQISSRLSNLIYIVTTLDSEDQWRHKYAFDTEAKISHFAGLLERHQKYGNVGFKVAGLHITQLKSVCLTLVGPVIAFVGNLLINGHF
ncbi:uncharacterized protein LOC122959836 [Acropora millepora]|uniref:uncharacterized protein LOC122959836 n=1 Tax=Acropora millepora TaxID=45264 RepID=UPI001CF1E4C7|nr:uncharacterized protein LOC122959836 [Acropora millepora]